MSKPTSSQDVSPQHIGFIVDGNRRWAKKHGLPAYEGHLAGYEALKEVCIETFRQHVPYVSVYVFSTENWRRSQDEVSKLMNLITRVLKDDLKIYQKNNIRLRVAGTRQNLSEKVIKAIETAEAATAENTGGDLVLCFNYGGHQEIVDAAQAIVARGVSPEEVTEDLIAQYLYTPGVPAIDLIVRTSGEERLSNFQLWRAAYSELLFLEKPWPEMTKDDVDGILKTYTSRQRRFGG